MSNLVDAYFAAWNAHDGARLAALFEEAATYEGPTTRMAIHPYDLVSVITALAAQFSDFAFIVTDVVASSEKTAAAWTLNGTNDGVVKTGVAATGRKLHISGVDMIEVRNGRIAAVRRVYDRRAMMEQLGLQVLVEPYRQGQVEYGYSLHASSGSKAKPGIIALTWINGRDESERDRVRS